MSNFSGSDITVRWESAADDVVSYLIKWISLSGGDLRQVGEDSRTRLGGDCVIMINMEYMDFLSVLAEDGRRERRGDPGGCGGR